MDGWMCGDCKSLNTPRAKRCYRCNVPRAYGERKPEDELRTIVRTGLGPSPAAGAGPGPTAAGPLPPGAPLVPPGPASVAAAARPRPAITDARSSRGRSRVLVVLLALTTAVSATSTVVFMARGGSMGLLLALLRGDTGSLGTIAGIGVVSGLLTFVTAIAWFIWFDRVLRNVPPLTGQWPDTGRAAAIGWWLVPVVGFIKAPRIVGDVYHRLSVRGTPGLWLLALWASCWIGGTIGPAIAVRVAAFLPFGVKVYLQLADLISLLGQASYVAAGVFAIALVIAIEQASHVRRTSGGALLEVSPGTAERGAAFEVALRAAAEANAVAKVEKHGIASPATAPYRTSRWPGRRGSPAADVASVTTVEATGTGAVPAVVAATPAVAPSPGLTRNAARPAAAMPPGPPAIPVTDDDMPVLRPVLRPPAYSGERSAIAQPEGPAGSHAAGSRSMTFARDIPVIPLIPLDPEGEVLAEGSRPKRGWSLRLPRWALGLAALVAVLAVAATVLLAGTMGSAPSARGTAGGDDGRAPAVGLSSPAPSTAAAPATAAPAASASATSAPAASASGTAPVAGASGAPASPAPAATASPTPSPAPTPSPTPQPTPEPWIAARERLVADTFSEDWRGRMDLEGTLKVGDRKPATWALSVARDGDDEWARTKVTDPAAGLNQTTEQVFTRRTTWVREGRGPWASRDRGFGDQPTEALFGVRSVDDLTFLEAAKEDGKARFRFRVEEGSDLLALAYLRTLGLGPLERTDATVVTDADGVPVRAELTYAGTLRGAKARLTVEIRYKDVGGAFHIASPKDGGPVVDD